MDKISYFKLKPSLFHDYFLYIDTKDYHAFSLFRKFKLPNMKIKQYYSENSDFIFCLIKCRKKYSTILNDEIFPTLQKNLTIICGSLYLDIIEKFYNAIEELYKARIIDKS